MLIAKFSEIFENSKFIFKYKRYIKLQKQEKLVENCCNFSRKTWINAKCEDGQYVWFDDDEEIVVRS